MTDKVAFLQPEQESLPGSSNKLLSLICLKSDSLKLISQFCCSVIGCKTVRLKQRSSVVSSQLQSLDKISLFCWSV